MVFLCHVVVNVGQKCRQQQSGPQVPSVESYRDFDSTRISRSGSQSSAGPSNGASGYISLTANRYQYQHENRSKLLILWLDKLTE